MKILSLFDGMACGMIAMLNAGIEVESYDAYEFDVESADEAKGRKFGYAALVASHNFPNIRQHGDVFKANFTQYEGVDFLVGGSPCTYWSIAQKNNRETEASGMGWELFSQYVRAVKEAKPKFFIYENNKSMSAAIRESIDKAFGFEAVCINSALVSAQNRQRLYWVGMRNPDGTYSKVPVDQPEDRGILLRDILDGCVRIPEYGDNDKARPLNAYYPNNCGGWWLRMFSDNPNKQQVDMVAQPVGIGYRGRMENGKWVKRYESNGESKANALTTAQTDSMVACPVRVGSMPRPNGDPSQSQAFRVYSTDGKSVNITAGGGGAGGKTGLYAVPVESKTVTGAIPEIVDKYGYLPEMFNAYNRAEITDKAPTLSTGSMVTSSCAVNRLERIDGAPCVVFAEAVDWDEEGKPTKAISGADGKTYPVYQVKDGYITIKDKQYPIKLADGFYIIRKLTVPECMRLQTVPEWYDFSVISNSQAYKCLGNGWTCDVITHLIDSTQKAARRKWLADLLGDCI